MTESATEGLWREGDHWAFRYRGREARLRHGKGLAYLGVLLRHAGSEIHVLELVAAAEGTPARADPSATRRAELTADDATRRRRRARRAGQGRVSGARAGAARGAGAGAGLGG